METYKCKECGIEKPLTEFYKDKRLKLGIQKTCKECVLSKKYVYSRQNKESIAKYNRMYYKENAEKIKEYQERKYWGKD